MLPTKQFPTWRHPGVGSPRLLVGESCKHCQQGCAEWQLPGSTWRDHRQHYNLSRIVEFVRCTLQLVAAPVAAGKNSNQPTLMTVGWAVKEATRFCCSMLSSIKTFKKEIKGKPGGIQQLLFGGDIKITCTMKSSLSLHSNGSSLISRVNFWNKKARHWS